jgi:hypothetical protein
LREGKDTFARHLFFKCLTLPYPDFCFLQNIIFVGKMRFTFMKKIVIFALIILVAVQSACLRVPPRCKIPNCNVAIDHNHAYGSETRANGETKDVAKVWRGVPYFSYVFRKKFKAQESRGYYRKIDGREAYDKRKSLNNVSKKKKKKKKTEKKETKPEESKPAETQPENNEGN